MRINEVSSIGDAIFHLSRLTQYRWSEAEFAREVIRLCLPLYAVAPDGRSIVSRERVDGRLVVTPRPDLKANYVTLLRDEIEQLSLGGQTITDRPAWIFGDAPYSSWSEIQDFRAANHRVLNHWDTDQGEWMGHSEQFFFASPIGVTPDTTLVVPRHTIAELAKSMPAQSNVVGARPATATNPAAQHRAAVHEISHSSSESDGPPPPNSARTAPALVSTAAPDHPAAPETGTDELQSAPGSFATPRSEQILGITKAEVITAFGHLIPIKDLAGALADGKGIYGEGKGRLTRGTKDRRHLARWCPIYLAAAYYEMYNIPKMKLNRAFTDHAFLRRWLDEWDEKSEHLF